MLQARAAAAGALLPARSRAPADAALASLTQELADAHCKLAAQEAQLSKSRAQAEEAGGLLSSLTAELETVKAQVGTNRRGIEARVKNGQMGCNESRGASDYEELSRYVGCKEFGARDL